ncbi:Nucleoside-diphosphate-sugar epimerase [Singulisphaera sp. GP187]|uniref:NAD-dependent epimerase/dehydratase family protein n=1 Tax=Singulisphaera sp. GP187 TaxID=1882752 RepID=UPI00092CBBC7|nr:NAD-dependent epimerase/dehydratase family protein [Singulisphaera sp. GP187]SIO57127.1 Nucleoside-diphosphate-sugar epimerase [Singulisphaera sp. GP187]
MNALVTGGGGFLGHAIVRSLRARGDTVRSLARGDYPELRALGAEPIRGDVADPDAVLRAVDGCDVVFHVAAKAGIWGPYDEYHRCNVEGTRNVLAACRAHGVRKLVHTSSPSVVFDGRDMEGVNESVPYASHFDSPYPATKAEAERLVLAADGAELATTALRPHLIWGPGDNHLIPRLIARARAGRLRRIGRKDHLVDTIYIDNAAEAHLLAADHLGPDSPNHGKAYFLSQGEPWPLWSVINGILAAAGVPPVTRSVPRGAALLAGTLLEQGYRTLGLSAEPPMTRFLAHQLSTAHWFDITAARRDFGYHPTVSIDEGLRRLEKSFQSPGR